MKLRYISTKKEIQKFIEFTKEIYKDNLCYRDSMSEITGMFLYKKTSYFKHAEIYPFFIEQGQKIMARAAFIIDYKQKDLLMVSFFEARRKAQDGVNIILDHAVKFAKNRGLRKIAIGLNAHLNYGVGFLASHFDVPPTFGLAYNPEFYLDYFQGLKEYSFISFYIDVDYFRIDREQKILDRIKKNGFNFRFANFKNLDREIKLYTYLNNRCFQNHLWWADRTFAEDQELLYPFRWFIQGENLIFAEKDGVPIGFMLWYPDYNQLIAPGKGIGLGTLLKSKLGIWGKIDRLKISELCILPEYQGTGVVVGFFELLYSLVRGKYRFCEAGWIEENNLKSKGLGIRWQDMGCQEYKKYQAYEVSV